jgi:hypothetical protein
MRSEKWAYPSCNKKHLRNLGLLGIDQSKMNGETEEEGVGVPCIIFASQ